jgi:hypothetical protein
VAFGTAGILAAVIFPVDGEFVAMIRLLLRRLTRAV